MRRVTTGEGREGKEWTGVSHETVLGGSGGDEEGTRNAAEGRVVVMKGGADARGGVITLLKGLGNSFRGVEREDMDCLAILYS